ncbi:DNA repair exonuclease [Candidatus Micrarchaeota archaeon]|nr:DNA repair exonuclease [Candidatus Micrarchaeota archaeon]MBU1681252.1 DNA repair exonuclease [Candidatus Micrarchaeota archaeon]
MKIAIFSDNHLGYPRFEEDSYKQAEMIVNQAGEQADLLLCAGDIFDTKIPKLETLKRAVDIFNKPNIPIFAIFGNHERRAKDMVNPVHLLAASSSIRLLHGNSATFEKNGEKVQIFGMGSVPEEYAETALKKSLENFQKEDGTFSILMLHQSIKELMVGSDEEISLEFLERLPFDLIINGHIHETTTKLGGKFIIPGSTVITQLRKEETAPKGYYLYDTASKKAEFVPINSRKFFYEKLEFEDATEMQVREAIENKIKEINDPAAIISIKVEGKLKEGLTSSDLRFSEYSNVYIDNKLNSQDLSAKLERIRNIRAENLSIREIALAELSAKTSGKVSFDSSELFEKLLEGSDEAHEFLEKQYKKDSK